MKYTKPRLNNINSETIRTYCADGTAAQASTGCIAGGAIDFLCSFGIEKGNCVAGFEASSGGLSVECDNGSDDIL